MFIPPCHRVPHVTHDTWNRFCTACRAGLFCCKHAFVACMYPILLTLPSKFQPLPAARPGCRHAGFHLAKVLSHAYIHVHFDTYCRCFNAISTFPHLEQRVCWQDVSKGAQASLRAFVINMSLRRMYRGVAYVTAYEQCIPSISPQCILKYRYLGVSRARYLTSYIQIALFMSVACNVSLFNTHAGTKSKMM
jgi:hypothetical protein